MPSTSPTQARFMAAAAHDPKFAKSAGIPMAVAREFNAADKGTGILAKKKKFSAAGFFDHPDSKKAMKDEH